ncbi:perlucin-like [Ostrea edulis]|uniref:perlucin-like n=1 Tax=Ostrea edulis TaxID=37623 RepID=UPI002094E362|nr:perlucin-like [Ostrea edulis]
MNLVELLETLSRNSFFWTEVSEWKGRISVGHYLWRTEAHSRTACSYICLQDESCVSFFYQNSKRFCQGHSSVFLDLSDAISEISPKTVYFKVACIGGPAYIYERSANTCFSIKEKRRTWNNAQSYCISENAWLLDMSDHQILSLLMTKFNNYQDPYFAFLWYWIGLTDIKFEGHFIWTHSKHSLNGSIYWLPGQPDNANGIQHCVYMRNEGGQFLWDDIDCMVGFIEFICQSDVI